MGNDFSGKAPIYYQIAEKICNQIVRGEINPGDKLPSVRELAVLYGVNPNTVKRVYMELNQMEVSQVHRGQGTFVTENQLRLDELREQLKKDKIEAFISDMEEMGVGIDEITKDIQHYFNHKKEGRMTNE